MPHVLIHGIPPEYRGETVCKFSATLTVRNLDFSECQIWAIFTVFRYYSIIFDIFRSYTYLIAFKTIQNCLRQRCGADAGLRERSSCADRYFFETFQYFWRVPVERRSVFHQNVIDIEKLELNAYLWISDLNCGSNSCIIWRELDEREKCAHGSSR